MVKGKYKILVIDDEPAVVELLKYCLEKHGYKAITAKSGAEGLKKANSQKPDLILLDIIMPEMDGFTVLRQLRAENSTCKLPIILLTAKSEINDVFEAEKYRATDYVIKPVELSELLKLLEKYLAIFNI
jgi:DNA-binding response OmpR family regulator